MKRANSRRATPDMIAAANPPDGYEPITSTSAFGWENGPIFESCNGRILKRGFRVAERHTNAGGALHGGMIMTFADILLAGGVQTIAEPPFVTVRCTTDFIGPAFEGEWVCGTAIAEQPQAGLVAVAGTIEVESRTVASISGIFKLMRRS